MTPSRAREVLGAAAVGARLLVRTADGVLAGRLVGHDARGVALALRSGALRIALADVEALEVVREHIGRRGRCSPTDDDNEGSE